VGTVRVGWHPPSPSTCCFVRAAASPGAAGISPPARPVRRGPSYSPAMTPADKSHPLPISQAKANHRPQAMCQLPLPTAPALLPAQISLSVSIPVLPQTRPCGQDKMFLISHKEQWLLDVLFVSLLRYLWFRQQLRWRKTKGTAWRA